MTPSDKARRLREQHPELTATEIARRLGVSRQAVDAALAVERPGKRGRPSGDNAVLLRRSDLGKRALRSLESDASERGVSVRDVIVERLRA